MQSRDELADRLAEFEEFVWIHTADAFQQQFDTATDIPAAVLVAIEHLLSRVDSGDDEEALAKEIQALYEELGSSLFDKLIQLVGLTRNKLVTDVDALGRAAGSSETPPRTYEAIPRKAEHWSLAAHELASRFRTVF